MPPNEMPRDKMRKVIFAIDIDGTLITNVPADIYQEKRPPVGEPYKYDTPNRDIIELLVILSRFKNVRIVVWSGGGKQYAEMWGNRLHLDKFVWRYAGKTEVREIKSHCAEGHFIAVDDIQACDLGDVNLIVRQK